MTVAVILVKGFPYVALKHLCHKTVSCSANGSYLLKNGTAFSTIFQRSFQSINLPPEYGEPGSGLFFSLQEYWALFTSPFLTLYTIVGYVIIVNVYSTIVFWQGITFYIYCINHSVILLLAVIRSEGKVLIYTDTEFWA
ncbi:Uncharacterised protein [Providencia rustigianii]|nr:Uncharacterised protein [Providencia rustigianii]